MTKRAAHAIAVPGRGALVATVAYARANADEDRDLLSVGEALVVDCLKAWGRSVPVDPHAVADAVEQESGLLLPVDVVTSLLLRARRRKYVYEGADGRLYPDAAALFKVPSLADQKHLALARTRAACSELAAYALLHHASEWSQAEAYEALEELIDEFGADLARARRRGSLRPLTASASERLVVAYGFAAHALDLDPTTFDYLVDLVHGTMVFNTLYSCDFENMESSLPQLEIYLDTPVALRALGFGADPVVAGARDTLELAAAVDASVFVFEHTAAEMKGILGRIAEQLRRGTHPRGGGSGRQCRDRDALEAARKNDWTSGVIEEMEADLETHLAARGIRVVSAPPHVEHRHVDELRLEEILKARMPGQRAHAREKDILSLTAIDRRRGFARPKNLEQTTAVFVTPNVGLVHASLEFFREEERSSAVRHCVRDLDLAAQLWVRTPKLAADIPRSLLIATCCAVASAMPAEVWERANGHMDHVEGEDDITVARLHKVVRDTQARAPLLGPARARAPEGAVAAEAEELADEPDLENATSEARLRAEAAETTVRATLQGRAAEAAEAARRNRRRRAIGGYAGVAVTVTAFVLLALLDLIDGRVAWAIAVPVAILVAAGFWAAGTRQGWKAPFQVLIVAGAITALGVAIYSIWPD